MNITRKMTSILPFLKSFLSIKAKRFIRFFGVAGHGLKWGALCLLLPLILTSCHHTITGGMLDPKGVITGDEEALFFDAIRLMLIVVIPVIIMSFVFAFRYRASRDDKSNYKPDWGHNVLSETIWWGVPCLMIIILSVWTWNASHKLDPYRKMAVPGKPLLIQAVSLRWKWLFIYPEQKIATINYVEIPKDRQVEFWITSDAPMSAFFIPQLSSQIYSMAGMRTRLHMVATVPGVYRGINAQYNGDGFSDMKFKAKVLDTPSFNAWVQTVKQKDNPLTIPVYKQIVKPTRAAPVVEYSSVVPGLFKRIMMQYMKPNMRLH